MAIHLPRHIQLAIMPQLCADVSADLEERVSFHLASARTECPFPKVWRYRAATLERRHRHRAQRALDGSQDENERRGAPPLAVSKERERDEIRSGGRGGEAEFPPHGS